MATVVMETIRKAVDIPRGQRILARQQATLLNESDVWNALDDVSILDQDPGLAAEPLMVRRALAERRVLLSMPAKIEPDELIEITPDSIRLRKRLLDPNARKKEMRRKAAEVAS